MAPIKVDPDKVCTFKDADSFYKWLGRHHDKQDELWIKNSQGRFGIALDHAEGSDRRRVVLGLDRRGPQEF